VKDAGRRQRIGRVIGRNHRPVGGVSQSLGASSGRDSRRGKDSELAEKLAKAAETMRDSGNLYITWARHYVAMAEGNTDASSDEDETEDFDI
jgi:hypothetical protein